MRAFLGIELDTEWRGALTAVCAHVREQDGPWRKAKWVAPENLHVTLKFLGEIDTVTAKEIAAHLSRELTHVEPFVLPLDETVCAVPSQARAKMLWTTLLDPAGDATRLAGIVQRVALPYGIEADTRDFHPHITLARTRRPMRIDTVGKLDEIFAAHAPHEPSMSVQRATLYKSTLTRQGPIYEILARVPLGQGTQPD